MIRQTLNLLFLGLFICYFFSQCKAKSEYDGQDIEFKPLKEFSFTPALIPVGTPLDLIAYSGGKANTEDEIYYYQFIGVDKKNDTFRILSTIISVYDDKDAANKIYTPTSQYDPEKRVASAIFYPQDSTNKLAIDFSSSELSGDNKDSNFSKINSVLEGRIKKSEFVVINKSMDIFLRDYKTAFGVLHFKEIPW
jgi:hypothetical protein